MPRKRKWGNTNSSRAKLKKWAKGKNLPPTDQWQGLQVEEGKKQGEYKVTITLWYAGNEKPDGSPPDDIVTTFKESDFSVRDIFYARGQNWRQSERGKDIEGISDDFDYMLEIDIDSPT